MTTAARKPDAISSVTARPTAPAQKNIDREKIREILRRNNVYLGALNGGVLVIFLIDLQNLAIRDDFSELDLRDVFTRNKVELPDDQSIAKITTELKQIDKTPDATEARPMRNHPVSFSAPPQEYDSLELPGIKLRKVKSGGDRIREFFRSKISARDLEYLDITAPCGNNPTHQRRALTEYSTRQVSINNYALDPNSDLFDKVAWLILIYDKYSLDWTSQLNATGTAEGEKFAIWLEKITSHLKDGLPGVDIAELKKSPRISLEQVIPIHWQVLSNILVPLGVLRLDTEFGPSLSNIIDSLTTTVESPSKKKVSIYSTYSLTGFLGSARSISDFVILPTEHRIATEIDHENAKLWWEDYKEGKGQSWPSLIENPVLIRPWVEMHTFGPLPLEEADLLHTNEDLTEALIRSDIFAYAEEILNRKIAFGLPREMSKIIESILKTISRKDQEPHLSLFDEFNRLQGSEVISDKILRIACLLGTLEQSPIAAFTLTKCLSEKVMPIHGEPRKTQYYDSVNDYMTRLLAIEFFGRDTLEKADWLPFLAENLKDLSAIQRFNGLINEAARKARVKQVLTLQT